MNQRSACLKCFQIIFEIGAKYYVFSSVFAEVLKKRKTKIASVLVIKPEEGQT